MIKQDTRRQGRIPHKEARQGNPIRGKIVPRASKRVRDTLTPIVRSLPKDQADGHNLYTEHLVQITVGSVLSTSGSVS